MLRFAAVAGGSFAAATLSTTAYAFFGQSEGKNSEEHIIVPIRCHDGTSVVPWSAPPRSALLNRLKTDEFDVLVIGGGCVGAGCALDASTRGLKVALVERDDFAAGTSGRSTKLIHGGIRYLEAAFKKFDIESYRLVEEALEERAWMIQSAPYMARPLPIMIPLYSWWQVPYFWAGAKVYDLVAGRKRFLPPSHFISKCAHVTWHPAGAWRALTAPPRRAQG